MKTRSYLLAIDGSQASRSAAHFAWELAKQTDSQVVAQHVVDTTEIWRFLSYDLAGFIGSGLYMDARERITEVMYSVAEALMLSYGSQAEGQSLRFENYIDEGEPTVEIARRAVDHDLVILGFHARRSNRRQKSLFEELAKACPCPVLVVRDVVKRWSKMQIFVSRDMLGSNTIDDICQMGEAFGLPLEILLDTRDNELTESDRARISLTHGASAFGVNTIRSANFKEVIDSTEDDVLLVVSADALNSAHDSLAKARIYKFLQASAGRALLLWRDRAKVVSSVRLAS
jgi:nucleotide-binding universal stress UspA family protein